MLKPMLSNMTVVLHSISFEFQNPREEYSSQTSSRNHLAWTPMNL